MTDQHCPGFETNKDLSTLSCICSECGTENEIFSDETDRKHKCAQCKKEIQLDNCEISTG